MLDSAERHAWDRLPGETTRAHAAFLRFRDLGPSRKLRELTDVEPKLTQARNWSARWSWHARAAAWDDEQHMIEDRERLESLRSMHSNHRTASRAVQAYALAALQRLSVDDATAGDVARLLDLGTRLERLTLSQSVEQLQSSNGAMPDDPWSRIARELADT